MSAPQQAEQAEQAEHSVRETACYVYGIVPADVETDPEARGVGDPPAEVSLVTHGDLAAIVSEIPTDKPLGRPEHLHAHQRLLDAAVAEVPVLPLRFGAVVANRHAVAEELLKAHHDEFAAALRELEGRAEFIVKGRYVEEAILREVLAENPELARLRAELRDKPEDATRNERMTLGEAVNRAVAAKRDMDTRRLVEELTPLSVSVNVREPTHEEDAAHVAFLVELDRQPELEQAVAKFEQEWAGRVALRLLGPLAPYDFVVSGRRGG